MLTIFEYFFLITNNKLEQFKGLNKIHYNKVIQNVFIYCIIVDKNILFYTITTELFYQTF